MKRSNKSFLLLLVSGLFSACKLQEATPPKEETSRVERLPYFHEASFTPLWLKKDAPALDTLHTIPDFSLQNQDGTTITKQTFAGKIYVANFFFTTCPGICPRMKDNMRLIQKAFEADPNVLLISHSVTPNEDTVPILKQYAKRHHISSTKWHLVTGNQKEIYQLGRQAYFVEEDLGLQKKDDAFLHTENFVLIDTAFRIRGIYNGLNLSSIQTLIQDIKTLKQETSSH